VYTCSEPQRVASHPRRFGVLPTAYAPTSHSPYTLPSSVSRKPCICHSCENAGGVWVFFPFWKSLRDHSDEKLTFLFKYFLFRFLRTLLHAQKLNSFIFRRFRTFCAKTPRGWGIPSTPRGAKYKPDASGLLIDVVFGFQALQQRLEKWFVRLGRSADRLRHFLSGRREITLVRRDPRQRQVADPMIRILLRNLRIQFKSALGVPRSLQAASVGVQLNRAWPCRTPWKALWRILPFFP